MLSLYGDEKIICNDMGITTKDTLRIQWKTL